MRLNKSWWKLWPSYLALITLCAFLSLGQGGTPHGVNVTWGAPSPIGGTGTISGYNIYRCTNGNTTPCTASSGVFAKIDTALDLTTGYFDQTPLVVGQAYSYVSTVVDSGGNESPYSNVATIIFAAIANPNPPTGCAAKQQ